MSMNALLALTTVLKTVTILETAEGLPAAVILDTHWALMNTPVLVCNFIMRYIA